MNYDLTILYTPEGIQLVAGIPSDYGQTADCAHEHVGNGSSTTLWVCGAELDGVQTQRLAGYILARLSGGVRFLV